MSNLTRGLDPVIKFVKEEGPRYVLVIEDTASMNLQVGPQTALEPVHKLLIEKISDIFYHFYKLNNFSIFVFLK